MMLEIDALRPGEVFQMPNPDSISFKVGIVCEVLGNGRCVFAQRNDKSGLVEIGELSHDGVKYVFSAYDTQETALKQYEKYVNQL